MALTLFALDAHALVADVYFQPDFAAIHARPDPIDRLATNTYVHAAALRPIPGTTAVDLDTPHGYGGPAALTPTAFIEGVAQWRQRQQAAGRICEFLRLHPFLDVTAVAAVFDSLRFDRHTVVVDLSLPAEQHWAAYSKGTRHALNRARRHLTVRRIAADQVDLFIALYESGLERHGAQARFWLGRDQHRDAMAAPWASTFVAETDGEPVGAAMFLQSGVLSHYHLSGVTDRGRELGANYLLLEHAFAVCAAAGARWMHLGGGRSAAPDDALFRFKAKFSRLRLPFHTAGLIFDRDAYDRLGGASGGRFQGYRG